MTAGGQVDIVPVNTRRQLREFIDFPHRLYRENPAYVPRLYVHQREMLSRKNPFFLHSEAGYFLAMRGSEIVGRIAWFLNNHHIGHTGRRELFFGFFDVIDDRESASALLNVIERERMRLNCESIIGPIEFSTNDTCGLLREGHQLRPAILMPYNAPYYHDILDRAGFRTVQELHAYEVPTNREPPALAPLAGRISGRLSARGIRIRTMDFRRFDAEVRALYPLYEKIYSANWGYCPMTWEEFRHQAEGLRQISRQEFVLVAEENGTAIGYSVGLYDINSVLAGSRNGRLLPLTIFRLLHRASIRQMKIINLGVVPEYRSLGIDVVMYAHYFRIARSLGIRAAEASYVMGSNHPMISALHHLNAALVKKYAIYQRGGTAA